MGGSLSKHACKSLTTLSKEDPFIQSHDWSNFVFTTFVIGVTNECVTFAIIINLGGWIGKLFDRSTLRKRGVELTISWIGTNRSEATPN